MKKGILFGGLLGILVFLILGYFSIDFLYNLFNSFSYGLGQDKFITKNFIAFGLSFVSWVLMGFLVGYIFYKNRK